MTTRVPHTMTTGIDSSTETSTKISTAINASASETDQKIANHAAKVSTGASFGHVRIAVSGTTATFTTTP